MNNFESWLSFEVFELVLGMRGKWVSCRELSGMYFFQMIRARCSLECRNSDTWLRCLCNSWYCSRCLGDLGELALTGFEVLAIDLCMKSS